MTHIETLTPTSQAAAKQAYARNVTRNFLLQNSTWSMDSIVSHLLMYYGDYGVTRRIIAEEIQDYVMSDFTSDTI